MAIARRGRAGSTSTTTTWRATIGTVALALILFEGGLAAGFSEIRPVLAPAVALAVLGTLVTACGHRLRGRGAVRHDLPHGMLIGSIVAATDGASVFAILRGSTLRRRLARTLEGEAGLNDPVAVLLVLASSTGSRSRATASWTCSACSVASSGSGWGIGAAAAVVAVQVLPRLRLRRPASTRWRRSPSPLWRSAPPTSSRVGLPRRLPRRPRAGQLVHRRHADDGDVPRRARLARPGGDVS